MKTRFHHEDLLYGVLLAAIVSFAFATLLNSVHVDGFAAGQAVAATPVATQAAPAVASATQAAKPTSATR